MFGVSHMKNGVSESTFSCFESKWTVAGPYIKFQRTVLTFWYLFVICLISRDLCDMPEIMNSI